MTRSRAVPDASPRDTIYLCPYRYMITQRFGEESHVILLVSVSPFLLLSCSSDQCQQGRNIYHALWHIGRDHSLHWEVSLTGSALSLPGYSTGLLLQTYHGLGQEEGPGQCGSFYMHKGKKIHMNILTRVCFLQSSCNTN